jgi:hypothetical protein
MIIETITYHTPSAEHLPSPTRNDVYLNTIDGNLYLFDGCKWVVFASPKNDSINYLTLIRDVISEGW